MEKHGHEIIESTNTEIACPKLYKAVPDIQRNWIWAHAEV